MFRWSGGVALGMVSATASAASGVLILVAPYTSPAVAFAVAGVATLPLVVLWRSLAVEDAKLPASGARRPPLRSRPCEGELPRAR